MAIGGISISTAGAAAGTATATYGGTVVKMAAGNFGSDYSKMQQAGNTEYKSPISGSGKEKATDVPSWARGNKPFKSENGKSFATRLMNEKYGKGNWNTSSREYSQIKKMGRQGV